MKKLRSIKALKQHAWKTLAKQVIKEEPDCATCNAISTNCGHFFHNGERNQQLEGNALWYYRKNLHGQCVRCNKYNHGNLSEYAYFLEAYYGPGILQELRTLRYTPKKWSREDLQAIIDQYK